MNILPPAKLAKVFEFLEIEPIEPEPGEKHVDIVCPFVHLHTPTKKKPGSTWLWLDSPHIWCWHHHCKKAREDLSMCMRSYVTGFPYLVYDNDNGENRYQFMKKRPDESRVVEVKKSLPLILKSFAKKRRKLEPNDLKSVEFLARLFEMNDVLWIGKTFDSGKPKYARNFRTLGEWLDHPIASFWPYTTGSTFKPGSFSRCREAVLYRRYFILEGDGMSHEHHLALFEWVEKVFRLKLQAIVDSGHESLHGWFPFPGQDWMDQHGAILEAAGFDHGPMTKPDQAIRLGNAINEKYGTKQQILWLKK
jgi:hypothetical protein